MSNDQQILEALATDSVKMCAMHGLDHDGTVTLVSEAECFECGGELQPGQAVEVYNGWTGRWDDHGHVRETLNTPLGRLYYVDKTMYDYSPRTDVLEHDRVRPVSGACGPMACCDDAIHGGMQA